MSETFKKSTKRSVSNAVRSIILSASLLTMGTAQAIGQEIEAYGARMCADAGIPLENCSLVSDPAAARNAAVVRSEERGAARDKTATLAEHGRRICEQENVPLEDCQALPTAYRAEQAPPSSFLTVPAALPPVDPALMPAASPPLPKARPLVRRPQPPAALPVRPAVRAPVLVGDPDRRYLRPGSATPAYRYAPPAAVAPALPTLPDTRFLPPPLPPAEPDFYYVDEPAPFVERRDVVNFERGRPERFREEDGLLREDRFLRRERLRREERLFPEEPVVREGRFRGEERSGRCLRAVRYSAPPSYRYVTC